MVLNQTIPILIKAHHEGQRITGRAVELIEKLSVTGAQVVPVDHLSVFP
jgi:hypothetical protein